MRHFKGTLGVACLLFTQKQPEHDEECSGCLLAWGFAKVSALAQSGGLEARLQALESGKQQAEVLAVELASLKQQLADKAQSSAIEECKQLIRQAQSDLQQRLRNCSRAAK
ncbi:hypothetical protein [Neisseria weaveri]|uniref:hypothetical protein n=1 Tax=Neisseria weaveri TaxID=28091 RepID=UPI0007C9A63E|nr:hypothetical protein [Neisseria weaveri]SAY50953.1 Uncharacterised protein [Neisseria weaveri]